ncbi:hypothetical protein HDE_03818 [Halotydeus destructor]|nr:hypothetical protein HDE_03818 [Halotydeus destructor]
MSNQLLLVLILVTVTGVQCAPASDECDVILETAFKVFGRGSATARDSLPVTVGQVNSDYCNDLKDQMVKLSGARKCFKGFRKTVFDLVIRGVKNFIKGNCKTREARARVARHMQCFANGTTPNQDLEVVLNTATGVFDHIGAQNGDQLIPALCCGTTALTKQFEVLTKGACDRQQVTLRETHFYEALVDICLGDLLDLICGPFKSQAHCAAKLSSPTLFQDIIENPAIAKKSDRLIVALVSVINAFDE